MALDDYVVILLAAGLGNRLAPVTRLVPKPCLPLNGQPLCMGMIDQLARAGASTIHVNVSYLADGLIAELQAALSTRYPKQGPRLRFWRESPRLETGGAIARIWHALTSEEPSLEKRTKGVFAVSGDLVGQIPVSAMLAAWEDVQDSSGALMVYRETAHNEEPSMWVLGHAPGKLTSVASFGKTVPERATSSVRGVDFANYQILSSRVLQRTPTPARPVSVIDLAYRPLLAQGIPIVALPLAEGSLWHNVGTPAEYSSCFEELSRLATSDPKPECDGGLPSQAWTGLATVLTRSGYLTQELRWGPTEALRTVPQRISLSETEHIAFAEGLKAFCLRSQEYAGLASGRDVAQTSSGAVPPWFGQPRLILRLACETPAWIHAPRPLIVGAWHFLELALSQRSASEGPDEWAALLLEPASRPTSRG